ncbi:hypothetical protein U1Q18_050771 [Sarracenia purpurea var. burkii]
MRAHTGVRSGRKHNGAGGDNSYQGYEKFHQYISHEFEFGRFAGFDHMHADRTSRTQLQAGNLGARRTFMSAVRFLSGRSGYLRQ